MKKNNGLNLSLFELNDEELGNELEETEAIAEETGEQALSETDAEASALEEEAGATNIINVPLSEAPQLESLQPGDEIDLITTFQVKRASDGTFDLEPISFTPVEEISPEELEGEGGAGGGLPGLPGAGGGIEEALGGGAPV